MNLHEMPSSLCHKESVGLKVYYSKLSEWG